MFSDLPILNKRHTFFEKAGARVQRTVTYEDIYRSKTIPEARKFF